MTRYDDSFVGTAGSWVVGFVYVQNALRLAHSVKHQIPSSKIHRNRDGIYFLCNFFV